MCNMCKYLTTSTREDGTTSAKCAIKDIANNTKQTLEIMKEYERITNKNALPNNECQYSYEGITEQCPCNR